MAEVGYGLQIYPKFLYFLSKMILSYFTYMGVLPECVCALPEFMMLEEAPEGLGSPHFFITQGIKTTNGC